MKEYNKIKTIFLRDTNTKKTIEGMYSCPEFEYLKNLTWQFTEKIDGTNVRIHWDGHKISFGGRTDDAQIPAQLVSRLMELFGGEANEQIFEQKFGETEVYLFGEGYGSKILKRGEKYSDHQDFILFDVMIAGNYQPRHSVENVAAAFGLQVVPIVLTGTLEDGVNFVKSKPKSTIGTADMEGVVGRPLVELQDRTGNRLIVKIKVDDFHENI